MQGTTGNEHGRTTAQRAAGRPQASLVVAMMGVPGAGKSTIARAIERELGFRRVCREAIRRAMFPRCDFSFVESRATLRSLLLAIEINCLIGDSTVVDGMTFSRAQDFEPVAALAARHGFHALPLLVECPPPLARERLLRGLPAAGGDRAADDPAGALFELTAPDALRIDGSQSIEAVCRIAIDAVAARMGAGQPARER